MYLDYTLSISQRRDQQRSFARFGESWERVPGSASHGRRIDRRKLKIPAAKRISAARASVASLDSAVTQVHQPLFAAAKPHRATEGSRSESTPAQLWSDSTQLSTIRMIPSAFVNVAL